jgi:hypothetical protein
MRSGEEIGLEQEQASLTPDQIYASLRLPRPVSRNLCDARPLPSPHWPLQNPPQLCDVTRGRDELVSKGSPSEDLLEVSAGEVAAKGSPLENLMGNLSRIPVGIR